MDSEQTHPNNQKKPEQSELDLGLSVDSNERVTPKKNTQSAPSPLEKLRGLFAKKDNQENLENKFSTRKEPTFTTEPEVAAQPSGFDSVQTGQSAAETSQVFSTDAAAENIATNADAESLSTAPENATEPMKRGLKYPESWAILNLLPQKHRRLFVALLAIVLLLIFFFILKPSADTVQSFEQQSNEMPIQFQPLDQNQSTETTAVDPMNGQEPASMEVGNAMPNVMPNDNAMAQNTLPKNTAPEAISPAVSATPAEATMPSVVPPANEAKAAEERIRQEKMAQAKAREKAKAEKAEAEARAKAEYAKAQKAAQLMKNNGVAPIVEAQPVSSNTTKAGGKNLTKTLTVGQGLSLMQVFRDNKLNPSEVSAMTKAKGSNNVLSKLKAGEKVQVSINGQHVTELRLSNGSRFIRQADGSYQFKQ